MIKGIKIEGLDELKLNTLRLTRGFQNELKIATDAGSLPIVNEAKRLVKPHRKSGTLEDSIHSENLKVKPLRVENGIAPDKAATQGIWIEKGREPFVIVPKRAKALWWKGAAHPVRKVNHPGNPAFPFMRPAFDTKTKEAIREVKIVFAMLIRRLLPRG